MITVFDQAALEQVSEKVKTLETTVAGKADKATTLKGYGITDAMTTEEVKAEIASQIGKAEHLKRIIVKQLPEVDTADTNAIYMVSKDLGDQQKYEEFMVINGAWEKLAIAL